MLHSFRAGLILTLSFFAGTAQAQIDLNAARFAFSPEITYDPAIPSPAQFLGYELGTHFTFHADVVAYLKALDAASDRVAIHEYGRTFEGRPLYYLVITTPENLTRIDEIRQNNLRLASGEALSDNDAEALIAAQPVLPWLSYNVHGNEPSSTEAAMQVAYRLAAATDNSTRDLLAHAVVLLDPCLNPDGRDRYVYWYRSMASHVVNPNAVDLEHDEPWPGGRTNHYWFDLNRDWVWLVHPESQGRLAAYGQWMPQVHMDYHEQSFNANYFTMPGQPPRNLNLPAAYESWTDTFGRANARAFDANRINYHTRESFDFFYPGYGSSYPSVMGAIGMLSEQGGHSRGGRAVETNDGYVLTFRQRIFDHYTTSLATIRTSVENREALLHYFRDFFLPSGDKKAPSAYLLPDDDGNGYTYDVVGMLLKHGLRVEKAERSFSVRDAHSYRDGKAQSRRFAAGTFVIPTNQPRHVFLNTIMQRQMAIEDSVMYDMATWSAPLAYNLDAAWTSTAPRVTTVPLNEAPAFPSGVENPQAHYAFALDWRQRNAPRALSALWQAGYRVRSARKAFNDGVHDFGPGSLIVLLGHNRDHLDRAPTDMARIARETGVQIIGMDSGRMTTGIDLASNDSRPVKKPRVAMLVDPPISSYTAGQIWFLFDRWTGFGIDRIRARRLPELKLSDYDVFVLPGAGNLSEVIDSTQIERLKAWVRDGGTLVGTERSALFLTKQRSGLTDVSMVEEDEDDKDKAPKTSAYTTYAAREDSTGLARIPGSAFLGVVDDSDPLAFGLPDHVYSLRFSTEALEPADDVSTVGHYAKDPDAVLVSGYASAENKRKLAGKAFAAVASMGRGRVVFLVDNTQYRMFWVGPARMMQNAVMLLPGM